MERAGDWRSSPRVDIGGGARDRTRRRQPAEQRRADVRNPLADQLLVRPVPESGHAVGDDARQQRLDSGEKSDGERRRSEEHTSELQSLMRISYAVFCLKKKKNKTRNK